MAYIVTYSENMSTEFMQALCPSAALKLKCRLTGCRMVLRRIYAGAEFSIEPGSDADSVPVVVWQVDSHDKKDLETFYPKGFFEKVSFRLNAGGTAMEVFAFVLRTTETALPDEEHIEKVAAAYEEHGFDFWYVEQAMDNAADSLKGGKEDGTLHTGTD